jgi:hypothetical protein
MAGQYDLGLTPQTEVLQSFRLLARGLAAARPRKRGLPRAAGHAKESAVGDLHPGRRVITRLWPSADFPINPSANEARSEGRAKQQMIDA